MKILIYLLISLFQQIKFFLRQSLKIMQFLKQKKVITDKIYNPRFIVGNDYPCLLDNTVTTGFDAHYLYHVAWACRKVVKNGPTKHVDISSSLNFCTTISAIIPTEFYDYRPAQINLPGLTCGQADLLNLPFADNSVESLSCMHVVEHIGLGRYGDRLDYDGDLKAIDELIRVLKPQGLLYFVVPICVEPTIEFNAHRKYSFLQVKQILKELELVEHSLITDDGNFIPSPLVIDYEQQYYGCGCFIFRKCR